MGAAEGINDGKIVGSSEGGTVTGDNTNTGALGSKLGRPDGFDVGASDGCREGVKVGLVELHKKEHANTDI